MDAIQQRCAPASNRRIRIEMDGSLNARSGSRKLLIALPTGGLSVAEFLQSFQQRHVESECSQLLCHVSGFALHPSELLPQVLRNEDVLCVKPDSTSLAKRRRIDAGMSVAVPFFPGHGSGLFAALGVCGAVFVSCQSLELPVPNYAAWRELWQEATSDFRAFKTRPAARNHLRFSQGEDLLRTLSGEAKAHTPDVRYNFGVGQTALRSKSWKESWKDLDWIPESFKSSFLTLSQLVATELPQLTHQDWEPRGTLGANILAGTETWAGSRLRHSLYPGNGSCTEHTDYGVLTLQNSTGPGLEALVGDVWQPLEPPPGFAVLFAGDMLEILTNGCVKALHHRVSARAGADMQCARQSNIIFLQPDNNTLVQPLAPYVLGNGQDLAAVRYGDWHRKKTSLAFRQP